MHRRQFLALAGLAPILAACGPMATGGLGEGFGGSSGGGLLAAVAADPTLSTFGTAVKAAGLEGRLSGPGPYTVFAPTNEAFARLGQGTLDALMQPSGQSRVRALLMRHIGRGGFTAGMLAGQKLQIATLDGGSLVADGTSGLSVDRAPVTGAPVQTSNGTLFKIARVLAR